MDLRQHSTVTTLSPEQPHSNCKQPVMPGKQLSTARYILVPTLDGDRIAPWASLMVPAHTQRRILLLLVLRLAGVLLRQLVQVVLP